jgi:hypothetical protein
VASYGTDKLIPTPSTPTELDCFVPLVADTLNFIGEAEPVYLEEIQSLISTILLVNSVSNI